MVAPGGLQLTVSCAQLPCPPLCSEPLISLITSTPPPCVRHAGLIRGPWGQGLPPPWCGALRGVVWPGRVYLGKGGLCRETGPVPAFCWPSRGAADDQKLYVHDE